MWYAGGVGCWLCLWEFYGVSRLWMVDEVFCRFVVSSCRFSCFLCVASRDEYSLCLLYCITYILLLLNKVFKWCSTWLYIACLLRFYL